MNLALFKPSVRAVVTLALTAAFIAAIFTGQPAEAVTALLGPTGITIGFYFRNGG